MRILITGGTGYLGTALVRAFDRAGHDVLVFARRASAAGLPGRAIDGDVRDRKAVGDAVGAAEAVCHAAALVSLWRPNPREFDDVNVGGLENVLDACRVHDTPRILYTSSFLARPPADRTAPMAANDYQRTKVRALELARAAAEDGRELEVIDLRTLSPLDLSAAYESVKRTGRCMFRQICSNRVRESQPATPSSGVPVRRRRNQRPTN